MSAPAPRSTESCARSPRRDPGRSSRPPTPRSSRGSATGCSCMSRGHVVETLRGDEITEERMIHAAVESTTLTSRTEEQQARRRSSSSLSRRRLEGDYAPSVLLVAVMVVLGAYIYSQNDRYFLPFNVTSMMLLVTALGFIALGQTDRADDRGHRPVGRSARRLPRGGRIVLPHSTSHPARRSSSGCVLMVVARRGRRARQRLPDPIREVHRRRRDPGHLHRPAGPQFPAARPTRTGYISRRR